MKMKRCWNCDRRRPMRLLTWRPGMTPECRNATSCMRAHHRDGATVVRWILGDHDNTERPTWREHLRHHLKMAGRP